MGFVVGIWAIKRAGGLGRDVAACGLEATLYYQIKPATKALAISKGRGRGDASSLPYWIPAGADVKGDGRLEWAFPAFAYAVRKAGLQPVC